MCVCVCVVGGVGGGAWREKEERGGSWKGRRAKGGGGGAVKWEDGDRCYRACHTCFCHLARSARLDSSATRRVATQLFSLEWRGLGPVVQTKRRDKWLVLCSFPALSMHEAFQFQVDTLCLASAVIMASV